jgi:radical SAM protein with 4Fe4S-binding SPASM domain
MRPLGAPTKVSLDLTSDCLLNCKHCRAGGTNPPETLGFDEVRRILDDLASIGVFRIGLSGGEPFLREDIVEILRHACTVGAGRVIVSTSGLAFGTHTLSVLHALRDRLIFKMSLDGPPAIHDAIRGLGGAYAAAHDAIRECVHAGFMVYVTTTLMRDNVRFVHQIMEQVHQLGCARHYLVELIPVGRATREMALTRAERRQAWETITRTRSGLDGGTHRVVARIPFGRNDGRALTCCAGISECGILPDGRVLGCRLVPQWVAGNVRERRLSELWADPSAFPRFRRLTARDCGDACAGCAVAESCRGGCRAYAFGAAGSLTMPDSRCPIAWPDVAQGGPDPLEQDDAVHSAHQGQGNPEGAECASYQQHEEAVTSVKENTSGIQVEPVPRHVA